MSLDGRPPLLWRGTLIAAPQEQFTVSSGADGALVLSNEDATVVGYTARAGDVVWVHALGRIWRFERAAAQSRTRGALDADPSGEMRAPMTGTVRRVDVATGVVVVKGQPLLLLEAMKMEHVVRASTGGTIEAVTVKVGDTVDLGAILVRMAPEAS